MGWVKLFLSPHGRIGMRIYAAAMVGVIVVQVFSLALPVVGLLIFPLLNYPGLCLAVKRLHDWNRSGFWMIAPYVVITGYILTLFWYALITMGGGGNFSGGSPENGRIGRALAHNAGYVLFLMPILFLALIGMVPGSLGANRFGIPWQPRAV
ncbi:DUF805 domain-containing protein [Asticcacaulis sp. AC402]|uniref:DUF805 domain-containing protein n=1 Tax=Asticcacaulis sp. AC402 TaxID=1282361 RepID=UPI0003C3D441|nr:DUF805 domain-containing protein [Asticcacaulis sp. AC402]ESQ77205.1 hypothetical protein ABAC402_02035 [Asticcacaulis sp. AC402]